MLCRTRSAVGRIARPRTAYSVRPRRSPPTILIPFAPARRSATRRELPDEIRRDVYRSAQGNDLQTELELADVRRDQRRVARGRRARGSGRERHTGEPGVDLALDPLGFGHRAARARRL